LDRIGEVRRALAGDIGVILPGVRLRDDLTRDAQCYAIRVRDRIAGEGRLDVDRLLAVAEEPVVARLGTVEREPVYGLPAAWIDHADREHAVEAGALVFDPISVLGSHLADVARTHAAELLGRQELQTLLEHLRASVPAVVKDVGGDRLPIGTLHRAFGLLLREGAWPRDPVGVLEAMLEASSTDPEELAEAARRTVVPALLRRRDVRTLTPLALEPEFERQLLDAWRGGGQPASARSAVLLRDRVAEYVASVPRERASVVCTAALRPLLAGFLLRSGVRVAVYGYGELPPELNLEPVAVLGTHELGG
jgi:flagellar biosynthesis protein FlhA